MTMDTENQSPSLEHISELPLDERAAAFTVLEGEIRQRLDEQPR
ncbi:MAG: hypothetical protein RLZZ441_267 [Actinomycetota bacterium]